MKWRKSITTNQHPDGRSRVRAKLSPYKVRTIRECARLGMTRKELASLFGVGEYAIRDVVQYRTYAWVE